MNGVGEGEAGRFDVPSADGTSLAVWVEGVHGSGVVVDAHAFDPRLVEVFIDRPNETALGAPLINTSGTHRRTARLSRNGRAEIQPATIVAASAIRWSLVQGGPSVALAPWSTSLAWSPRMLTAWLSMSLA